MSKSSNMKGVVLVLAAVWLAGCDSIAKPSHANQAEPAAQANAPLIREEGRVRVPDASPLRSSLQVAAVEEQSVEPPITVPGVVEVDPAKLIKVVPPLSGRIVQLHKHLGDPVRKGEALFTLDSADMAQAYSDAAKAEAALGLTKRSLERQKELARAEISARKDLEQAENDYSQAASEAQRAKTRLSLLGSALGRGNGRQYTLRSPIAGHVIELTGAQGGFWNDTNAPIMTVANLSTVWLAASVQEKDLASVFVGQEARISLNAYEGEGFSGKVRYVGELLEPDTRTVKVRIAIDNSSGRFRPGMFAKVVFKGPARKAAVVPATALVQSGLNSRIFVETSPWRFEPRVVKTGAQLGNRIEVVSGLKAGERIVVKEGVLLND
ncbi:efflux RND transporter periplasmic adaptor subunit [Geobacter argillaceus]|uniref:Cobalt-zinc-cadmium efflux system membrane fusion protein n=1 Tax=Geobacter argillaceus TaxID=345631 RepID=A0A562WQX0_9BACT|nr:efflux RND transporter periplasmic adaptor subunit [Geobacter argillaceus]TWJ32555.1 cobalt-zinc-cadmium efflux system membrane fusion protein [Geobacter argillaceus]